MTFGGRKATVLLFLGDIAIFLFSLWLTLIVRYGELPGGDIFGDHLGPFAILFVLWVLVFYMAGLYSKRVVLFKSELPGMIFRTQLLNMVLAALFFFILPVVGIAPKTNLAIYLVISLVLIFIWRLAVFPRITNPSSRERAALIGSGSEVDELVREVNGNSRYHLEFQSIVDPATLSGNAEALTNLLASQHISLLVVDTGNKAVAGALPLVYNLAFVQQLYQFSDFYQMYEEVFDRVPLSLLRYEWFLKNVSRPTLGFYTFIKRGIDIVGGLLMGIVTIVITPFIFVAMRTEGPGPLFLAQERIGQYGARIKAYKFRSMTFNNAASGEWVGEEKGNRVTRVGNILRITSLDEFPQCINILRGDISLVGPRNDIEGLGIRLAETIPYYMARYMVKPGITGWAQINQRYEPGHISPQSIEETKMRLAYDFYYIKHRSLALDMVIALKTFKRMLFRVSAW